MSREYTELETAAELRVMQAEWRTMTADELAAEAVFRFQHCDEDPCVCQDHIRDMFAALLAPAPGTLRPIAKEMRRLRRAGLQPAHVQLDEWADALERAGTEALDTERLDTERLDEARDRLLDRGVSRDYQRGVNAMHRAALAARTTPEAP